jgi:hypothetical protein
VSVPPTVLVCRACSGADRLVADLGERAGGDRAGPGGPVCIELVRCQDICKGPVVGLEVDGDLRWFRRLRGKKARRSLAKLVRRAGRGPVPERLRPLRVAERDGRPVRR